MSYDSTGKAAITSTTTSERVLVTGASGLVGSAVVRRLSAEGFVVTAVDKFPGEAGGVIVSACDLRDVHRMYAIACAGTIDTIIHCGGYSGPMVGRENPYDMIEVNVTGTANLLELGRVMSVRRFIYCSSMSVYGSTSMGPVSESSPLAPATVYGATKLAAEQLVIAYGREHGIDAAALRLSWVYGPQRTNACILRRMIEDAIDGRATTQDWGSDFPRQYIHSEDAAAALIAAMNAPKLRSRIYNITGESTVTLGELADLVRTVMPEARIDLQRGPAPDDDYHHPFSTSAARNELGFVPRISLAEGVEAMVAEIRKYRAGQDRR